VIYCKQNFHDFGKKGMNNFLLYGHGGSYNHGAEAITKTTISLLREISPGCRISLSTHFKEQDVEFGIPADDFCERDLHYLQLDKQSDEKGVYDKQIYKQTIESITGETVCLSVGGDTYCYGNWNRQAVIHKAALERGARSLLWSCSIDPDVIDQEMLAVLKSHHLITARESITYSALCDLGLTNVIQCADIAFELPATETPLPDGFVPGEMVAVNISPLIIRREPVNAAVVENIRKMMDYVLAHTDMGVVLIPHVVMPVDNDCDALDALELPRDPRICRVSGKLNASEYKYIISKCRFGVFARTHATIAAYSSSVPCIALGYSTKAEGIAGDLGLQEFVVSIGELTSKETLLSRFIQLLESEDTIRMNLKRQIGQYTKKTRAGISLLK
jgi:polysaccharide pyruvyl transferase WcaK-like protein